MEITNCNLQFTTPDFFFSTETPSLDNIRNNWYSTDQKPEQAITKKPPKNHPKRKTCFLYPSFQPKQQQKCPFLKTQGTLLP